MTKMSSSYLGNLRIESVHEKSSVKLITDAPVDNNGKGSSFSPTDLLATALMNCMVTIIGIYCDQHNVPFNHAEASIEKIMASSPRRVGQLNLRIDLSGNNWEDLTLRQKIENTAKACPVAKSISPDIELNIDFIY